MQEFDPSTEDFLDQILSSLPQPPWPDLPAAIGGVQKSGDEDQLELENQLRHHQIGGAGGGGSSGTTEEMKSLQLHQQLMLQFPATASNHVTFNSEVDDSVQAQYDLFAGTMQGTGRSCNQAQHHQDETMQVQNFGMPVARGSAGGGGGAVAAQPRQRVRARRGQATDPHSIAERLRRERIAERMKALQELVPNANKADKASMLDEIIDYVKFLQLQVKVLSVSRLGGAGAVAPLVADVASERTRVKGVQTALMSTLTNDNNDNVKVTEHQVAKLMEEDMGSAMQYLQGKGLCLMPISLATAISTATGQDPITSAGPRSDGGSSSPSMFGLTV